MFEVYLLLAAILVAITILVFILIQINKRESLSENHQDDDVFEPIKTDSEKTLGDPVPATTEIHDDDAFEDEKLMDALHKDDDSADDIISESDFK